MSDAHKCGAEATIGAFLCRSGQLLRAASVENPRLESRLLMENATGLAQSVLLASPSRLLGADAAERFMAMVRRRLDREPIAYILGRQGFWSLDLEVSPASLIPRADSEALVEAAIAHMASPPRQILDLGTGTGCLLLALLSEWPESFGIGVDLSPEAAALAARNARTTGIEARAAFFAGNWANAVSGSFDLIVSNPPYIETDHLDGLMPDVIAYEPSRALDGGADGLEAYRRIIAELPGLLKAGGHAVLELGMGQSQAVSGLAVAAGLRVQGCYADLNGIDRALILKKPFGEAPPGG